MNNKGFLFIFLFLITLQTLGNRYTETVYLEHEEINRSYELYVPGSFSPAKSYPVVLVLHGGGGTAKGIIRHTRRRFNQLADREGFVTVYPNGVGKSWNDGARDTFGIARKLKIDDVGFLEKVLEDLDSKIRVNRKKVFACGISNGGFMAQRLAFELSNKINGIAVVAANLSEVQASKKIPANPVPVLFINGTNDPLIPFEGGHVTVFRQKRGKVLSIKNSLEAWQKINGCLEEGDEHPFPDTNKKDGCTAIKTVWTNPQNPKIKVAAIKILEGGHTWPGANHNLPERLVGNTCYDLNGCDEIWNFFKTVTPE
ncbi:hypothetical protein D1164_03235 [Mariniphaga sediminis]|uniref:Dienelactone hydrolase domain-containing protein n=1 Tax=Mariniphaga sediminis TaxID=1628158 RepID=A0A399D4Y0_9BACT|nr:PHB depolymerase family esterase [Mariniphaga sediminis]RIH66627.1 hypothetical protein D1164_03235 [Mariniphaga sediminis]